MRRAVMGTVAMWLAGTGYLGAQNAPGYLPDPQMPMAAQLAPNNSYPQQQGYYDAATQGGQRQQLPPGYGPANAVINPAMANVYPQNAPIRAQYTNQYANPGMYQNQYVNAGMYQNQYANPAAYPNQFPNQAVMGRGMMVAGGSEALPQPNVMPQQPAYAMPTPGYAPMTYPPGYGPAYDGGDYCGDGYCNNCYNRCCPNGACGPEGRSWASAELLFFWTKGQGMPPLVTSGANLANPGIIGQPGTVVLFGGERVGEDLRMGVRARGGFWIDECQMLGVEGSFFYIANRNIDFMSECQVGDFVARPFFNTANNAQDAEIICAPGVLCGHIGVSAFNEMFGADANIRRNLCCTCNYRADLVLGFRYMHLLDDLSIEENLTNLDPNRGAVGEGFIVRDRFHANNNFYGGQVGAAGEFRSGQFFMDWRALVALGSTTRTVTISGSTTFLDPVPGGNPVTQPGGLLAQQSNIGAFTSNDFSVVPEFNINLGFNLTPTIRVWAGYTFMYWNNVMRAGEQIDLNVDPNQLPTRAGPGAPGTQPTFPARVTDVWLQGLSLGAQIRY